MLRSYKYLLRPNPEPEKQLDFLLWQSRRVYHAALELRIKTYQETGKGIGYSAQWAHFQDVRHANPDTFGQLNASSMQHLLRRLDKSFTAFFRRLKAGYRAGFPRYKSRSRFRSIEYTYGDGCKLRQNEDGRRYFYVQNVGVLRMCFHRAHPDGATINHAVIKRANNRWYVSLMLELPDARADRTPTGKQVGIDVGLKCLAALSSGELVQNPRWLRERLAKLRRIQRHASRQVRGSRRQQKTYHQLARLHEQVANQRLDYLHNASRRLVDAHDLIAQACGKKFSTRRNTILYRLKGHSDFHAILPSTK